MDASMLHGLCLHLDNIRSQTTSRCGRADLINFLMTTHLHLALNVFPYLDNASHFNAMRKRGRTCSHASTCFPLLSKGDTENEGRDLQWRTAGQWLSCALFCELSAFWRSGWVHACSYFSIVTHWWLTVQSLSACSLHKHFISYLGAL